MGCKAQGYEAIEKFLGEGKINPDNFQLVFGEGLNRSSHCSYPNRIKFEYEHDTIFEWDMVTWGDARVPLYLYLVAVYYPHLVAAYTELSAEAQKARSERYDLERELKAAKETIARQETQLTEIREAANP